MDPDCSIQIVMDLTNNPPPLTLFDVDSVPKRVRERTAKQKQLDAVTGAVVAACFGTEAKVPSQVLGTCARVAAALAKLEGPDVALKQVPLRAAVYRAKWPNIDLTPNALLKWWPNLGLVAGSANATYSDHTPKSGSNGRSGPGTADSATYGWGDR